MKKSLLPMKTVRDSEKQTFGKEALEKLLKQYFGYSEFRGKQLEAIEAVLSGRDCFCLMPTGGGKSMCYQIPALVKPGIVLVISPLIALMENQVAILKEKQIPAEFLSSTQTVHTKEKIHEDLNSGKPSVKLLYVTPELVATFGFMAKLMKLYNRGLLSLIAIDEAHCISTWGHDFRPSYRKLSSLRSKLPNVPVLALTATAAPKVEKDVIESLSLQHPLILRASFNRANIFYEVRYKDILKDAYTDLSNLLKSSGNVCAIVYCLERSTCDDLCGHLSKNGISSAAYHAGLNNKMRSSVLDDWLSSRIQVVVATVAFGMGIDRKDVRIVCHFNIPKSMEAFYQESGRAGRDQLPSRSVLYYGLDDRNRMEFILSKNDNKISQSSSSSDGLPKKALADFNQMVEYCEKSSCRRKKILESFGEQVSTSFCRKSCDACKHPNQVTTNLEELHRVSNMSKRNVLAPVFINSSCWKEDSEFWNRDDEASCSDEDISNSDDGEDAISKLPRSKTLSKAGLDERFKALERAEEVYYQNKVQNKQGGALADKKVITGTLREASKKRLLHALNQAQERLGNPLLDIEASATFLETECFKKYEKVGKTFYNSQIAATTRWLSSSSYEQIKDRLRSNTAIVNTDSSLDSTPGATGSSFSSSVDLGGRVHTEASNEEPFNDVQLDESRQVEIPMEKLDLPPIPSFSEFVNKKGDGLRDPTSFSNCSLSREVHRRTDSEKQGRGNAEKKMRKK